MLETYPRDELFQIDEDTLYHFALSILQLEERPRVRVLARRDRFDRFVSVLVYVPRERYSGQVRAQIGEYLAEVFQGHVSAYYPYIHDAPLTRVHFIIGRNGGPTPDPDRATLEEQVGAIVRTWTDGFAEALRRGHEPAAPARCSRAIATRFSDGYREAYSPAVAVEDIRVIEALTPDRPLGVDFYRARRGRQAVRRPQGLEPRPADPAVGARAGAGEHGLPGGRRATFEVAAATPAMPASGCTTWCWSAPTAAPADLDTLKARAGGELHRR